MILLYILLLCVVVLAFHPSWVLAFGIIIDGEGCLVSHGFIGWH